MTADAWLTLAVLVVLCAVFVSDRIAPTMAMAGAVGVLYLVDVVDASGAFAGFSNPAPITVAALYILAGAADITGALGGLTARALGPATAAGGAVRGDRRPLARVTLPVAGASAFVPNTPIVAMFAPRVAAWARRSGRSPSRFLLPLSYAAILGGVITLLGTSTNLVVSGLLSDAGEEPLRVFTVTPVGLPVALAGVALLVLVVPWLLPERNAPGDDLASTREFTVEMTVLTGSPLAGCSVTDAQLRNLQGVFLVEIERRGQVISPVRPDEVLAERDRLVFAGDVERIVDLQSLPGLGMAEEHHFAAVDGVSRRFFQAVVSEPSRLNGSTVKEVEFRNRYGAAVVAVHRAATRLGGKLGDVRLHAGDVLLVVAEPGFERRMRADEDFLLVAPFEVATPMRRGSARLVELATLGLIVVAGSGLVDLTKASIAVAFLLVATKVVTPAEARRSINLDIILMIAFSFGLGNAVAASGLATESAAQLLTLTDPFGDLGVLAAILLATAIATELLSNNAAAAVMFPIALATATESGIELLPLAIGILVMASCSFLTPIGYQTNTMVFGMGGYRFTDFARVGAPLTIVTFATALLVIPIAFPLR